MYVQPKFIPVNALNIQITTSKNIPPHRREVFVSGHGNCFYRAFARWKDEIKDGKHEEILKSSNSLFATFLLELLGEDEADYLKFSRNCRHIFTCASLLKRPICTHAFLEKKGFSFEPIVNTVSFNHFNLSREY